MTSVEKTINESPASEVPVTGLAENVEVHNTHRNTHTNGDVPLKTSDAAPQSPQVANLQQYPQGYYAYQQNQTPNSPSSASLGNGGYDIQSLIAQQAAGNTSFGRQQYNSNIPPLSPAIRDINSAESINLPPASPLFPGALYSTSSEQIDSNMMNGASMFASNATPSFQYLSGPPPSPVISYGYPPSIPNSPEARNSWPDRGLQQQHLYNTAPAPSPHIHGIPMPYQTNVVQSRRAASFDGEMLPPPAVDDNSSAMFTTGGTLFSQQSWVSPPDIYTSPQSSLQAHLGQQITSPPRVGMHGREQHISGMHANPYYPAATPGPPIQTTQNNKGPDGANLFIFHIPNHFTNLDMWHLFCHYGNLLSVRIMVEKDTGRSRGFGFVSYDSPDAAAMAIKELNGFVIGNKRLKVQHKQIRPSDNNPGQQQHETIIGPPSSFQENHVAVGQSKNANWNGNEAANDAQPPLLPDVTETNNDSSEHVTSALTNLESIRDALPDVQ